MLKTRELIYQLDPSIFKWNINKIISSKIWTYACEYLSTLLKLLLLYKHGFEENENQIVYPT